MADYRIKLDAFEGPMDLLMHLIEKNKVDIYDIPIAVVTEQYLEYLQQFQEFNIEVASEFLVMAATLLQIKSRILLPKMKSATVEVEEEIDPRQELVERLIEYRKFKEVSEMLNQLANDQAKLFFRMPQKLDLQYAPLDKMDVSLLFAAFQTVLEANVDQTALVSREAFSIQDKMLDIMALVSKCREGVCFTHAFTRSGTRAELIVTFLAVLELIKLRKITIEQNHSFAPIYMKKKEWAS